MANEIRKFEELEEVFRKMLVITDPGVLKLLPATFIANQMNNDPVWLMFVASSSGGKSELIQSMDDIVVGEHRMVFPISDLTTNTFASGMKRAGKETSLLNRIPPGGLLAFKDFTSMLSKRREDRVSIMSQLREIYDQSYNKETGTGDSIKWVGRLGAIAGSTEMVYQFLEDLSAMGDRFVMYSLEQPTMKEMREFKIQYENSKRSKKDDREMLKDAMASYCAFLYENIDREDDINFDKDEEEELIEVADFCAKSRSGVIIDVRRGEVDFVPSREMPWRMIDQLHSIGKAFLLMKNAESKSKVKRLSKEEIDVLYKIAFDSVPVKRRMALIALARYAGGVRTKGLATTLNYPSKTVAGWLAQLNGLGICERSASSGGPKGDLWIMNDKYREIMKKLQKFEVVDDILTNQEDTPEDIEKEWEEKTGEQPTDAVDENWDNLLNNIDDES